LIVYLTRVSSISVSVGNLVAKATLTTKPPTSIGGGSSHYT